MSRKIFFLGIFLIAAAGVFVWYQASSPDSLPSTNTIPTPLPVLNELPKVAQPSPIGTTQPAVTPTSSSAAAVRRDPPERLVLLAQSATPGQNSKDPLIKDAKNLIATAKYREAQAMFQQANQQDPVTLYYLGMMSSYFAERESSLNYFNAIKALNAVDTKIIDNVQKMLDAYALFDTYQDGQPEFLGTLIAQQFLVLGEVDLAIGKLQYLAERHPDYVDVNTLLGAAYLTKGNYDGSVRILSRALPSERPEIYYWLGVAHLYQENFNKAIAAFQLSLDKGYKPVFKPHEKMGDAYLSLNNFDMAVAEYKSAYSSVEGAEYVDLYVRPVWILLDKLRRPDEALVIANQAVSKVPRNAMSHNLVGWVQLSLRNYPEAKIALDRAVGLDSSLSAAYLNLGAYYSATGDMAAAKDAYEKAITFDKPGSSIGTAAKSHLQRLVIPTAVTTEPEFNAIL